MDKHTFQRRLVPHLACESKGFDFENQKKIIEQKIHWTNQVKRKVC